MSLALDTIDKMIDDWLGTTKHLPTNIQEINHSIGYKFQVLHEVKDAIMIAEMKELESKLAIDYHKRRLYNDPDGKWVAQDEEDERQYGPRCKRCARRINDPSYTLNNEHLCYIGDSLDEYEKN